MARKQSNEQLEELTVDELRERAKEQGIGGISHMRKEELIDALSRGDQVEGREARSQERDDAVDTRGDGEEPVGDSKTIKYSQHVHDSDEHEERPGRSLITRSHSAIKQWAEERKATPATVPGTRHGGRPGVLRFDFPNYGGQNLEHISWDEWFETFDERNLNFIYQEHLTNGRQSNFFRLDNPDREDA